MATLAALGRAAFVEAMRFEQTLAEMADRSSGDVVLDDKGKARWIVGGEELAARLDNAGCGEGIPQRPPEAEVEQEFLLVEARIAAAL